MKSKSPKLVIADRQRSQGSTGTRVSTGRFSPASPKGGFATDIIETARYIDERYGYRAERYYRQRLLGETRSDRKWREDLNQYLLGRKKYKSRSTDAFPWLPRFPKKKWASPSYTKLQESYKPRSSKQGRNGRYSVRSKYRSRFHRCRPNRANGYQCPDRKRDKRIRYSIF